MSSRPWIVPSSPKVPCSTGKTTSSASAAPPAGDGDERAARRHRRQHHLVAVLGDRRQHALRLVEQAQAVAAGEPAPVLGDGDRHHLVALRGRARRSPSPRSAARPRARPTARRTPRPTRSRLVMGRLLTGRSRRLQGDRCGSARSAMWRGSIGCPYENSTWFPSGSRRMQK